MKNNLFVKTFLAVFVVTLLLLGTALYASARALSKDPQLAKTITDQLMANGNIRFEWDQHGGSYENLEEGWQFGPKIETIQLDVVAGNVLVLPSSKDQIEISARGLARKTTENHLLVVHPSPDSLEIQDPENAMARNLEVTVKIPQNFKGLFLMKTVNGNLSLQTSVLKKLQFESVSGNIEIQNSSLVSAQIKTVSGDVQMTNQSKGNVRIETISGDVQLKLAEPQKAKLSLDTTSGEIRNPYSVNSSGEYEVSVETTSGDIEIQ